MPRWAELRFPQIAYGLILVILALQFGGALAEYVSHAGAALMFPYPLDYTEGPMLDQTVRLANGENIYQSDWSTPPYTITTEPPLFHLLQAPFIRANGPALAYGRLLTVFGALLTAVYIALTVHTLTGDWLAAIIGGLTLFAMPHILQASAFARPDLLALGLSWAGLFVVVRGSMQRRAVIVAAVLFALSIYTQPLAGLVAALTAFIWLWQGKHHQPMKGLAGLLGGLVLALFFLLTLLTQGGFFPNVVRGQLSTLALPNFVANGIEVGFRAFYLALGCGMFLFVERLGDRTRSWPLFLPYGLLSVAALFFSSKGASVVNTPVISPAALAFGAGVVFAWARRDVGLRIAAAVVLAAQLSSMLPLSREQYAPFALSKVSSRDEVEQLAERVRAAQGPVLADEYAGLLPLNGQPVHFQPYEFWQLNAAGRWDDRALIAAIQRREFPLVMLYEPRGREATIVSRWSPPVRNAIWDHYQLDTTLAEVYVYVPKQPG